MYINVFVNNYYIFKSASARSVDNRFLAADFKDVIAESILEFISVDTNYKKELRLSNLTPTLYKAFTIYINSKISFLISGFFETLPL